MSSLNPRARGATSQRTRIVTTMAAVVIPTLVLAACSDTSLPVTAPPKAAPEATSYARGERPPNAQAGLVFCDVALLAYPGKYRVKTVPIKVAPGIFDPKGKTVKVGFRGWEKGVAEPASLALCRIPDTPAATDFFKSIFSADSVATPKMPWRTAAQSSVPTASVVDDGITIYESQVLYCEMQILPDDTCETPPTDEGSGDGPPPVQDTPPDLYMGDGGGAAYYYDDGSGSYAVTALACWGRTDYPHLSGTPGYFGNANVHATTWCNATTAITVSTVLQRWRCVWWIFCSWIPAGTPGFNARIGTSVTTNSAQSGCNRGWYKGSSYHTAVYPVGLATGWTAAYNYLYC
jgi:hypothetical protein